MIDAPVSPPGGPEVCDDAIDNDGDGRTDCADPDCSGIGNCPVCGSVENPEGQPLSLPDGVSSGTTCSVDADCTNAATPNCISSAAGKECHASYVSTLNFIGFPMNATLTDPTKLLKVCVTMEHSWLRDLQIELMAPDSRVFILDRFVDRSGGEIYLGQANDSDSDQTPVPGVGAEYCWTPTATDLMVTSATQNGPTIPDGSHQELKPGDYKSSAPWSALTGAPLNGMWSIRVTDLWGIDNGFIFKWSIAFDPSLVSDCTGPIIE